MAYPDKEKLNLAPTFGSGLKTGPESSAVYNAVANNPLIDTAKKSGTAVALGQGINTLARNAGNELINAGVQGTGMFVDKVKAGANAINDAAGAAISHNVSPVVNAAYSALTGSPEQLTQKKFGLPQAAEIGVPFDAADGRRPGPVMLPGAATPAPAAGMMVQYGPEPAPDPSAPPASAAAALEGPPTGAVVTRYDGRGNKTISAGDQSRTVPASMVTGTDRAAVQAAANNQPQQAQRNLAGSEQPTTLDALQGMGNTMGTTRGNGYEVHGTAADAARFMAPTGVNAGSMAAMKGQFDRMNAYVPTATRTPSIHGDESGMPKMLGPESGIGWKTREKMYGDQMDAYKADRNNSAAMARENLSQSGQTTRTGMTNRTQLDTTGMNNQNQLDVTGMTTRNQAAMAQGVQAGEDRRRAAGDQFKEDQSGRDFSNATQAAANDLRAKAALAGLAPDQNQVSVTGGNELNVSKMGQVTPKESFSSHVVPGDPMSGTTARVVATSNLTGNSHEVVPQAAPEQKPVNLAVHIKKLKDMTPEQQKAYYSQQDPATQQALLNASR